MRVLDVVELRQPQNRAAAPFVHDHLAPLGIEEDLPRLGAERAADGADGERIARCTDFEHHAVDDGERQRDADGRDCALALFAVDGDAAAEAADVRDDDVHADAAAGILRDLVIRREARREDEAEDLLVCVVFLGLRQQPFLARLAHDFFAVHAAAVIANLDDDLAAFVLRREDNHALFGLAGRLALIRQLDAVIHGVADDVHQRVADVLRDVLVHLGVLADEHEPRLLAEVLRHVADDAVHLLERAADWHHAERHDAVLQFFVELVELTRGLREIRKLEAREVGVLRHHRLRNHELADEVHEAVELVDAHGNHLRLVLCRCRMRLRRRGARLLFGWRRHDGLRGFRCLDDGLLLRRRPVFALRRARELLEFELVEEDRLFEERFRRVRRHVRLEPDAEADVLDGIDGLRVFEDFLRQEMELRRDVLHAVQHAERADFLHAAVRLEMERRRIDVEAVRLRGLGLRGRDEILLRLFLHGRRRRRNRGAGTRARGRGFLRRLRLAEIDIRVIAIVNLELAQEIVRMLPHVLARIVRRLARVELVDFAIHEIDRRQHDVRDGRHIDLLRMQLTDIEKDVFDCMRQLRDLVEHHHRRRALDRMHGSEDLVDVLGREAPLLLACERHLLELLEELPRLIDEDFHHRLMFRHRTSSPFSFME